MGSRDYIVTTFGDEAGSIGFRWVLPLTPTHMQCWAVLIIENYVLK